MSVVFRPVFHLAVLGATWTPLSCADAPGSTLLDGILPPSAPPVTHHRIPSLWPLQVTDRAVLLDSASSKSQTSTRAQRGSVRGPLVEAGGRQEGCMAAKPPGGGHSAGLVPVLSR